MLANIAGRCGVARIQYKWRPIFIIIAAGLFLSFLESSRSATFSANAQLTCTDSTGSLSWQPANNALTVECWFKLSIPSGTNLTEDMTILVNETSYDPGSLFAYLLRLNVTNGNVE